MCNSVTNFFKPRINSVRFTLLLSVFILFSIPLEADIITREIGRGVTYSQQIENSPIPLVVNILKIDLSVPGVKVRCGQARDMVTISGPASGREGVHSIALRNHAVAAINADFFPFTGDPLGLAIRDSELLSEPMEYRACMGFGPQGVLIDILLFLGSCEFTDGFKIDLDGINRIPSPNEISVLSPSFAAVPSLSRDCTIVTLRDVNLPVKLSSDLHGVVGSVVAVRANQPLPVCPSDGVLIAANGSSAPAFLSHCSVNDIIKFRFDCVENSSAPVRGKYPSRSSLSRTSLPKTIWKDVTQAVGGGPWLVKGGMTTVDGEAEGFPKSDFIEKRHPRSAAGVTRDGKLLLVTVDGRRDWSAGCTLYELAELMKSLGAVNALNLDGGGSSTMFVGGGIVNAPSDGRERPVADSLLVYADGPPDTSSNQISSASSLSNGISITAGVSIPLSVNDMDGKTIDSNSILWGTEDGLGFVSQRGVFRSFRAGSGFVTASASGQQIRIPINITAAAPQILKASFGNEPNNPPDRNMLHVAVTDRFGNSVVGVELQIHVSKGDSVPPTLTDSRGTADIEIVWDALPGKRSLLIDLGNGHSLVLKK